MSKPRKEADNFHKLCQNRKIDNFDHLKEWDRQRARKLMIHRKIIDELDDSIQQKLRESNSYLDLVRQFLLDLLTQKVKYEQQIVNNPQTKITNNLAGKLIHRHSSKTLGKLYQLTTNNKPYKKFKLNFEAGLQKLDTLLNDSQKQMTDMRTKIELKIVQIQNCNEHTLTLCNNLVTLFNKTKNLKEFHSDKDMYREQQQFIYQTFLQTQMQRQLGNDMIAYLDYVGQLQKKKLNEIKQVLATYLDGVQDEKIATSENLTLLKDILNKQTEDQYIETCYCDGLLSKAVIDELCAVEGRHRKQLSFNYIKLFLKKLDYNYFEFGDELVLKQWKIFMKIGGELQEVTLLVTVDAFLNIYLASKSLKISDNSEENLHRQICFSFKLEDTLKIVKSGDINLVLQPKKLIRSEQYSQMNTVELILANEHQRQQFIDYLQSIILH